MFLRWQLFREEAVLSFNTFWDFCFSLGTISLFPFETLEADFSGGVGKRGSNFGLSELKQCRKICPVPYLPGWCYNAPSERTSSLFLAIRFLTHAEIGIIMDVMPTTRPIRSSMNRVDLGKMSALPTEKISRRHCLTISNKARYNLFLIGVLIL